MTRFIPTLVLLAAVAGLTSAHTARASDVNVSLGVGNHGYYYPYSYDYEYDPYVTYYDDSGTYPYAYDTYGYYQPSYNWNTSVDWYSGWHGSHDHDRDYWRGRDTGYRYGRSSDTFRGSSSRSSTSFHGSGAVHSGGRSHR